MYKIYINETPLCLTTMAEARQLNPEGEKNMVLRYPGKKKFLINVVHQLENSDRFGQVIVFTTNLEQLWKDFRAAFQQVGAAGGVVFNGEKVLLIFRRGFWDLPKGKIDDGESTEAAALREVEEETGIRQPKPGPHIMDTYHTYEMKGKRVLKTTYWYLMETEQAELTPQTDEDIESAQWTDLDAFLQEPGKVYGNILDVLHKAKSIKNHG